MKHRNWVPLALFATVLLLAACQKKEGCTDPASTNYDPEAKVDDGSCTYAPSSLLLHVSHTVGTEPFAYNTTYQDGSGRNYQIRTARFHVSSPRLNGTIHAVPEVAYVQIKGGESSYSLGEVTAGDYQGFSFDVGVDSAANHGDPTLWPESHPLSILNSSQDHWSWNSGYVFLKIEGYVDSSATMNGTMDKFFYFHIAMDSLLTPVQLIRDIQVTHGLDYTLNLAIDWEKALSQVDLRRQSTQTNDNVPLARQVMQDFVTGIKVE